MGSREAAAEGAIKRRSWWRILAVVLGVGALLGLLLGGAALHIALNRLGAPPIEAADATSVVVLDRKGRLLRPFATPEGRWRLPVEAERVDSRYIDMLLAYEDKRFWRHPAIS